MQYDVAPDGQRILVVTAAGRAADTPAVDNIIVVLNFFEELRQRVPTN